VVIETPIDRVQYWTIVDADGKEIDLERDHEYLLEAVNAYPRLRVALDKALEACRALVGFLDWCGALSRGDMETADKICPRVEVAEGRHPLMARADKLAREALEMGGNDHASTV
jgi:hypothetical protein